MPEQHFDPWLAAILFSLAGASIVVWSGLIHCWQRGPFPPYEPRRPVPWNWAPSALAVLFVVAAVLSATYRTTEAEPKPISSWEQIELMGLSLIQQALLVGAVITVVVMTSGAQLSDVGLPEYADGFVRDVKLGIVTWLAALLPVFGLQAVLVTLFGQPSQNPLIHLVSESPHPMIFVLAFVAAVIVAPICEELTFRLLLQGWLEKWEDRRVRIDDSGAPDEGTIQAISGDAISLDFQASTEPLLMIRPARRGLAGLPYGGLPILISSTFFALSHFGYGPDPIPLFVFALILGFVYQRTHRIVPCIVAHAAFNLLALVMLWRMIAAGSSE